jgi:hypothetical protein
MIYWQVVLTPPAQGVLVQTVGEAGGGDTPCR